MRILISFLLIMFFSSSLFAFNPKGCITVFHQNKPVILEVELPPFQYGVFQTEQFKFANLPNNMIPDKKGNYCYKIEDKRFAFVNIYYYAVNQIAAYNKIFKKIGLSLPKTLTWKFYIDKTSPSGGNTDLSAGEVHAPSNVIDPQVIYHELGHWFAFNAMQPNKDISKIKECLHLVKSRTLKQDKMIDPLQESIGISEGAATILASFYSGITHESPIDGYDLVEDNVNNFVRIPDYVPSIRDNILKVLNSPKFLNAYPEYAEDIKKFLDSNSPFLDYADPYATSAIINQSLWQAAGLFGSRTITIIYLKALNQLTYNHEYKYTEMIAAILHSAHEMNPEIEKYLKKEYSLRIS